MAGSPLTPRARLAIASVLGSLILSMLGAVPALAVPVPGIDDAWDARTPGGDSANWWADSVGTESWRVRDALYQAGPVSAYPGITGSYLFDLDNMGMTMGSFQGFAGTPTNTSSSFEIWFKPDDLTTAGQIIFETGGNTDGLSITLNNDLLRFRAKDNANVVDVTHTLASGDITEFIQVVGVLDLNATATLYVNGAFAGSSSAAGIFDWAGNNASGLGARNSQVGGNNGGDLNGYDEYAGQIALFRFYGDQVLSLTDVTQNYNDIVLVPEPSTGLLVATGLILLGAKRRRSRAR